MGLWEDIAGIAEGAGAGLYSALDSALFGLPGFLVNTVGGSEATKALEDLRKRHSTVSTIGDIAGFLAPTGGGLLKGLGKVAGGAAKIAGKAAPLAKAAPALGRVAETLTKGGRLVSGADKATDLFSMAKRGALGAAEQAIPRALASGDMSAVPSQIALGGVAGGIGGKLIPAIGEKIAGKARKGAVAGALGLKQADYNKALKSLKTPGAVVKGAERLDETLEDLVLRQGITSPKKAAAFSQAESKLWQGVDDAFRASGKTLASSTDELLASPSIQRVIQMDGGAKALDKLISEADSLAKTGGLGATKARLSKISQGKYTPGLSFDQRIEADAADALSSVIDDMAAKLAPEGTDMAERLRMYGAKKAVDEAAAREAKTIGGGIFGQGSDTAAKLMGAGIGAGTSGLDLSSPEAIANTLGRTALGYLGGNVANKLLPSIGNKAVRGLTRAGMGLGEKMGRPVSDLIVESIPKAIGRMEKSGEERPELDPAMAGEAIDEQAAMLEAGTGEPAENIASAAKQEAAQELNSRYADVLETKLRRDWQEGYANVMTFPQFMDQLKQATATADHPEGFDPSLAGYLFWDDETDRAAYMQQYAMLQQLKAIDMNAVLEYQGALAPATDVIQSALGVVGAQSPEYTKQKQALGQLETLLWNLKLKPGQDLSKEIQKVMNERGIRGVLGTKGTREEKAALLEQLLQAYGFDTEGLRNLGLYEGIA